MFFRRSSHTIVFMSCCYKALLIVLVGSYTGVAQIPAPPAGDTTLASQMNQQALDLAKAKKYDSAIYFFRQAATHYQAAGAWDRFFYAHQQAGYHLNSNYHYAETSHYLDSIARQYSIYLTPRLNSYQGFFGVLAWSYFKLLDYDRALYHFKLMERAVVTKPIQSIYANYYKGVIYQRIGQYDLALKYMLITQELGHQHRINSFLGRTYNNLGIIYRNLGEYERALEFYQQALAVEKQYTPEVNLTPIYNNLGMIYFYLQRYAAALAELEYAISVLTNYTADYYPVESSLINTKAQVLIAQGEFGTAKKILDRMLAREIAVHGESWIGSGPTLKVLGDLYAKMADYTTSNTYYDQSIAVTRKVLGNKTDKLSEVFNLQAKNYLYANNPIAALQTTQQSLMSLAVEFNDSSFLANPDINDIILDKVELIESQYLKAKALLVLFNNTGALAYLQAADRANQVAVKLTNRVRKNMLYESSKLNLSNTAKTINEQAIALALLLEKEENLPAAGRVLAAMENSKAYLLSEAIHQARALGYSNLPEPVLAAEDSFRTKIKMLAMKRNRALLPAADTAGLTEINRQLFAAKESFEDFTQNNTRQNRHSTLELASVQGQIRPATLIIEYFAGEEQLYALAFTREQAKVYELTDDQELPNRFVRLVNNVQELAAGPYQTAGNDVYKVLLAPILADFPSAANLVIIPDKQLGFMPFAALIVARTDNPRYNNLHYLVKNYTLMQHQSVGLYIDSRQSQAIAPQQFIGFAPGFANSRPLSASDNTTRNELQPLPFARDEVEIISALLDGEKELGADASEARLKTKARSYKILHLATHAVIDEENPIYSRLIFSNEDSLPDEDGELHSFEIYGMQLNCALVTLSACNTGTGQYLDGEGVFSLGRGFLAAGAKGVLTSLWEVSDRSTSQIMASFYTHIKNGQGSPQALRKAKLEYLSTADALTANPYYWAAFVYVGRPDAIYASPFRWFYWLGIILLLVGGLGLLRVRQRRGTTSA